MSDMTDLLSIVINMLFVFMTVSFVSSAATDMLAELFKRREILLAQAVAQMLDDKRFEDLSLAIYNNPHVNPRVDGTARSKAELAFLPTRIEPQAFATALLEALHIISSPPTLLEKIAPLPVDERLPETTRIENAITNATRRLEQEGGSRKLLHLVTTIIHRCRARHYLMAHFGLMRACKL
jgi:hypothetical protein